MLVVLRFRVATERPEEAEAFRADLDRAVGVLAERPGYRSGRAGRNVDDPSLWVLVTEWEHVGAYRRALSSLEVKLHAVPLLARAIDEPTAFEAAEPGAALNVSATRSLG